MKEDYSYLNHAHPQTIDAMYRAYLKDPQSVDFGWRKFFEGFDWALRRADAVSNSASAKEINVLNLIHGYRTRGHLFTRTNPVRNRRTYEPTLDLENFGLSEADLDTVFNAGIEIGIGPAPLRAIVEHMQTTYCRSIGVEYRFLRFPERIKWLQERMESSQNLPRFPIEEKRRILEKLNQAVIFENFLHTRYVGQKRFSLSGGETLIPALDTVIRTGIELGVEEFMIGMSHRGRLNVLANIMNKTYEDIFMEFEGAEYSDALFAGDVKYHLGFSSHLATPEGKLIKLGLAPNPSHLEAVGPVVQGMSRAKIEKKHNNNVNKLIPIAIHGDAALAAQGVVYETAQMSLLKGYSTGGTIHFAVNNQVGFTTNYLQGRSSTYCTDVAKIIHAPIFHVNADDAEAVVFATKLAVEYRQTFHTDVFIDLLGYRKYGHNEGDEPRFTQPKLYKEIARHDDPRKIYVNSLLEAGEVERGLAEDLEREFKKNLQIILDETRKKDKNWHFCLIKDDCDRLRRTFDLDFEKSPPTKLDESTFFEIGKKIFTVPGNIKTFSKIKKLYDNRLRNLVTLKTLDWAMAESMAYASLLNEGVNVRLSGQDSERGTFSHRHSVLLTEDTEERFIPLNNIRDNQGTYHVHNSLLSEYAVLGFEYGYSCASPMDLTIWEAQFGDFANGAQVVFDQFISCSEPKWNRMNGLVMYLPHGYEGQGPEHSSARIERYLELAAKNNMVIANCTTPANFFHLLRRHMKYSFRVPMILFTPKSLLRHPRCVSPVSDFIRGEFKPVLDDSDAKAEQVEKVLFCSGKLYYELLAHKEENRRKDVAIVRVEQLYPLPVKNLRKILRKYSNATTHLWVQEEPENMGAWPWLVRKFDLTHLKVIARKESATPATGFYKIHIKEQEKIIQDAFEFAYKSKEKLRMLIKDK